MSSQVLLLYLRLFSCRCPLLLSPPSNNIDSINNSSFVIREHLLLCASHHSARIPNLSSCILWPTNEHGRHYQKAERAVDGRPLHFPPPGCYQGQYLCYRIRLVLGHHNYHDLIYLYRPHFGLPSHSRQPHFPPHDRRYHSGTLDHLFYDGIKLGLGRCPCRVHPVQGSRCWHIPSGFLCSTPRWVRYYSSTSTMVTVIFKQVLTLSTAYTPKLTLDCSSTIGDYFPHTPLGRDHGCHYSGGLPCRFIIQVEFLRYSSFRPLLDRMDHRMGWDPELFGHQQSCYQNFHHLW